MTQILTSRIIHKLHATIKSVTRENDHCRFTYTTEKIKKATLATVKIMRHS